MNHITLNNGSTMPLEGFGVFQIPDLAQCEQAVSQALACGYRLIDTAAAYCNEEAVGAAIRKSSIPRQQLFITTKLWVQDAGYEKSKQAFQLSLDRLGLDYSDPSALWRLLRLLEGHGRIVPGGQDPRYRRMQLLSGPADRPVRQRQCDPVG